MRPGALLLAQRAVADSPRWTRAIEGTLGHTLWCWEKRTNGKRRTAGRAFRRARAV